MPRRRRQRISMPGGVGTTPMQTPTKPQAFVPSQRPPTPTPMEALVDYDDEDEEVIGPQPASAASTSGSEAEPSSLASVTPRQIQIPAYDPDEPPSDPEDDMLEALVTHNEAKQTPSPKIGAKDTVAPFAADSDKSLDAPPMQRDKRRRDADDDDDELLARIAAKGKRANSADVEGDDRPVPSKPTNVAITTTSKLGSDTKKVKLKIALSKSKFDGFSEASSTGARDGDGG